MGRGQAERRRIYLLDDERQADLVLILRWREVDANRRQGAVRDELA